MKVTIEGEFGEFHIDGKQLTTDIAVELAEVVKDAIRRQPGDKWHRTGALLAGVRAVGNEVVSPMDRLNSQRLADAFDREVLPFRVSDDRRVTKVLREVPIGKGKRRG